MEVDVGKQSFDHSGDKDREQGFQPQRSAETIVLNRSEFYDSLNSPAAQALLADARHLLKSERPPLTDPAEPRR